MELPPVELPQEGPPPESSVTPPPIVPELAPLPPGPGLPMSIVWLLLFFFVAQLGLPLIALLGYMMAKFVLEGRAGLEEGAAVLRDASILLAVSSGSVIITVVGMTTLVLRSHFRRALAFRPFSFTHLVLVCLMAPPLYIVVIQVYASVAPYVPSFGLLEHLSKVALEAPWWLLLIAGALAPGFSEELLCRGFLGRGLVARWGVVLGVLFASSFFGILHIEPAQACYAAFIGIVLHFVYLTSKSLLAPMLLHTLNNTIAFLPNSKKEWFPGIAERLDVWEKDGGVPVLILLAAVAAVATFLLVFYQTRVRWYLPDGRPWNPGYITAEIPPAHAHAAARSNWPRWWELLPAAVAYAAFVIVALEEFGVTDWIQGM